MWFARNKFSQILCVWQSILSLFLKDIFSGHSTFSWQCFFSFLFFFFHHFNNVVPLSYDLHFWQKICNDSVFFFPLAVFNSFFFIIDFQKLYYGLPCCNFVSIMFEYLDILLEFCFFEDPAFVCLEFLSNLEKFINKFFIHFPWPS